MNNDNKTSRAKEFFDYLRSDEFRIKTISACCIIMAATLILIAGELYNIYKGIVAVTDLLEDGGYNRVVEIYNEEKTPEDVLPILDVTSTTESTDEIEETNNKTEPTANQKLQSNGKTYVINKNSKKIHTENCSFVDRIKEENKRTVKLTEDEFNKYINDGYTTCSSCGG